MADYLRRLNETGIAQFAQYLSEGALAAQPVHLLSHPDTSEPLAVTIKLMQRDYPNRYEFGRDLTMRLSSLDPAMISNDRGLWTWLALYLFDQLCPPGSDGKRKPDKQYRYILSSDYRHYYRHLVRTPWQLSRDHGPNSRFLLLAANDAAAPLRRHGDILEQLGGTQSIIRSRPIIAEASRLYSDPLSGRPRKGAAGKGGGSIRRSGAAASGCCTRRIARSSPICANMRDAPYCALPISPAHRRQWSWSLRNLLAGRR